MRTGLTQRGWNNVLIFASLFMIVLFNTTHQKFMSNESSSETKTLLSQEQIITSIDFSGIKLERIGPSWRVVTQLALNSEIEVNPIISNWKNKPLLAHQQSPVLSEVSASFPITIYTAGDNQVLIFEVFINNQTQQHVIEDKLSNTWFEVNQADLLQLVPSQLFNVN